ncbi:MAG TPA: hypothetical protein C5S37_13375 [Methanophagales archaeon]|nr:hypothetical protein [Methanophagales archaeon]
MKKIGIGLVITLLVAAGAVYTIAYQPTSEIVSPSIDNMKGFHSTPLYVLNTTLPSGPDKLMVYKSTRPDMSVEREEVASLAKRLGLTGNVSEVSGEFILTEGQYHLEVNKKSGRVAYTDASRWMIGNDKDKPSNLPSDDEALIIARKILIDKGLMPDDAVLCGVDHPSVVAINKTGDMIGVGFEEVKVSFAREVNGLPVVGAGSKIDVEVGGGGDVISVYKVWREYVPYKEFSIITPDEAFEKLKKVGIFTGIKDVETASIDKVYLGYYTKSASEEQTDLQPVYVFEGEAKGDNETRKFVQYIPAAPELGMELPGVKG